MNALVMDSSASAMHIGIQKETARAKITLDVGMRQSEKILPAIDYLFTQLDMRSDELDCIGVCTGPGSFTGLRLAVSAAKAFSLAHSIPIYGISTLDVYAEPFSGIVPGIVSVIDAKKDRFYGKCFYHEEESAVFDADVQTIVQDFLQDMQYLVVGPGADLFYERALHCAKPARMIKLNSPADIADSLLLLTARKWSENAAPMQDCDGPYYARKSEAEEQLEKRKAPDNKI